MQFTDRHNETITGDFDRLEIRNCSGLVFEVNIRDERKSYEHEKLISVDDCEGITFQDCNIASDEDKNHADDIYGLYVTNSSRIKLFDNEFHDLVRAGVFQGVTDLDIMGNDVHTIRSDAFDFIGVHGVRINNNEFRDFRPSAGDHADAIQFWLTDTHPFSEDVEIIGNTILLGEGDAYQCIFIETKNPVFAFSRFRIAENVIYNGSSHGITVYQGEDIVIENNTVLTAPGFDRVASIYALESKGLVTIEKNIAGQIKGADGDNKFVRDIDPSDVCKGPFTSREGFQVLPEYEGYGANISSVSPPIEQPNLSGQLDGKGWKAVWS